MPLTVLVVEDDFLIAEDLRMSLDGLGWGVIGPAPSVAAAMLYLEQMRPSVAVLDMRLRSEMVTPVALALRDRQIPFVMSSSYVDLEALGGEAFIGILNVGKPCSHRRLHQALLDAINS